MRVILKSQTKAGRGRAIILGPQGHATKPCLGPQGGDTAARLHARGSRQGPWLSPDRGVFRRDQKFGQHAPPLVAPTILLPAVAAHALPVTQLLVASSDAARDGPRSLPKGRREQALVSHRLKRALADTRPLGLRVLGWRVIERASNSEHRQGPDDGCVPLGEPVPWQSACTVSRPG